MDEHNDTPAEFNSVHINQVVKDNIVDFNKKRKLQAEQLGLPLPKHKCWDQSFASEPVCVFGKNHEVKSICTHIINGKTEGAALYDGSEPESGKDSNSFTGDSDSAMSEYVEAKLEPEYATPYLLDRASASSDYYCDSDSVKYGRYSFGSSKDKLLFLSGEHPPPHDNGGLQSFQNHEEHLLEVGNQVDYTSSEYGTDSIEKRYNEELEDVLNSNGVNPNTYVLSSGRWTIKQDAQSGPRKPTIDQEFEQYFSSLML